MIALTGIAKFKPMLPPAWDRMGLADQRRIEIEELDATVAAIERGVRLKKLQAGIVHLSRFCADDARRHRVMQAERPADGDHPIAHLQPIGITEGRSLEAGERIGLQQDQIGIRIGTDESCLAVISVRLFGRG